MCCVYGEKFDSRRLDVSLPHRRYIYAAQATVFMARDKEIIGCLDEHWRTVIQIRSCLRRFGSGGSRDLTTTLHRLADAGEIERQTRATVAPGRRGKRQTGRRAIELFRSQSSE